MNSTNLKSALISAMLMALIGIITYVLGVGNIFDLDFHSLLNIGVIAFLTGLVSYFKSSMTTSTGTFGGVQIR